MFISILDGDYNKDLSSSIERHKYLFMSKPDCVKRHFPYKKNQGVSGKLEPSSSPRKIKYNIGT